MENPLFSKYIFISFNGSVPETRKKSPPHAPNDFTSPLKSAKRTSFTGTWPINSLNELYLALLTGNKESFIEVVESEALSLHALMMTSRPSFLLLKPNTLELISRIRRFREKKSIPVCFTLDAGPNIHLIYFKKNEFEVKAFIEAELLAFCENQRWIDDHMGSGPERIITA